MGKIFVGDTGVKFTLDTETDITGASVRLMKVVKPDLTEVSFAAIEEGTPTAGVISFTITLITQLNVAGRWRAWAKITHSDGTISTGEAEGFTVYAEGK